MALVELNFGYQIFSFNPLQSSLMMAEKTIHNPNKHCALVVTRNAVTRIGQGKTRVCPDYANHTSITLCVNHVERVFVT